MRKVVGVFWLDIHNINQNDKAGLDLGKGLSTTIVCTDYCNSRKKLFPMVASKKKVEIVVNDGFILKKHQKTMVEPMFKQKVIIFGSFQPTNLGQNIVDDHRLH